MSLKANDLSAASLGQWETEYVKGRDRMRKLVCAFYDGFNFGRFVKKYPHLKGTVTDLLIGDLFRDEVDKVWEPMEIVEAERRAEMAAREAEAMVAAN